MKSVLISSSLTVALLCAVSVADASDLVLGQRIELGKQQEITAGAKSVMLGSQRFTVLKTEQSKAGGPGKTWLMNSRGVVGRSDNVVLVSGAPPEQVSRAFASVGYLRMEAFERTQTARLHFPTFEAAAGAAVALAEALEGQARVTLPITYAIPKSK